MPKFAYRAYTADGSLATAVLVADNAAAAQRTLVDRNLQVVDIRPAKSGFQYWMARQMPSLYRVTPQELISFSRQLASFLRAGVPMLDALRLLQDETGSFAFRITIDDVADDLSRGEPLSRALGKHPTVFNQLYVDMIRAAEVGGNLDATLTQLARYQMRQQGAVKRLRTAMVYPAVILSLATVVVIVLISFVLPNFVALFQDFHADLPLPTKILLAIGAFVGQYRLFLAGGLILVVAAVAFFIRSRQGRWFWDSTILRVPVIGMIVQESIVERFTRTLATMLRGGIPIAQGFDIAMAACSNRLYEARLRTVKDLLVTGEGFSSPLRETGLFKPMVVRMVLVGEETGTLPDSLDQLADYMGEEVDYRVRNMIALIEPAMVVFVGVIVGFIAISVIMPMYQLLKAVH